jgi:D-alanyl-lipoteichoic acid acyltransferase DltB (MBOAT superfamily)
VLFSSPTFVLLFVPVAVAGFGLLSRAGGRRPLLAWLVACSLVFYAAGGLPHMWIVLGSLALNWAFARLIARNRGPRPAAARALAIAGVCANVALLAGYKLIDAGLFAGPQQGAPAFSVAQDLLIPLGLSFITFQQIAFLLDVRDRRIDPEPLDYAFFILFFPQLVMGPIVHFREIVPQTLRREFCGLRWDNVAVGLAIFAVGLFKKVGIADPVALYTERVFAAAAVGQHLGLVDAWGAAFAFQVQIYFDFSGYADMAIGLARLFNLNIPINFDSPLRATDRFDLWRRWHISFAMFMRRYVFWPLQRNRLVPLPGPLALALTALISGLWHGVGGTFILWGALQAALMLGGHYRRTLARRWKWGAPGSAPRWRRVLACLVITMALGVLFRAETMDAAGRIYVGMLWGSGLGFPARLLEIVGLEPLRDAFAGATHMGGHAAFHLAVAAVIIFALPPTRCLFERYWTALDQRGTGVEAAPGIVPAIERAIRFRFSFPWAVFVALLLVVAALSFGEPRRFIYLQF